MATKEEKIREAYGEYWGECKENIIENGWCTTRKHILFNKIIKDIEIEILGYQWRPKSLQGIENNNGWIKIESEDDLPKESNSLEFFVLVDGLIRYAVWDNWQKSFGLGSMLVDPTHYQPIQRPEKPIY